MECRDWSGWFDRTAGPGAEERELHVAGVCDLESGSIDLELRPGDEGIVDDPALYALELRVIVPEAGDTQVVSKTVEWHGPVEHTVRRVRIQGAATAMIDVEDRV